ncbi:MAG: sigma-54 dependent transcriptional regulator [Desulfobaccales bacterium]
MGNVLIIDDDELFCEMLSEMVTEMGHGVKFTHSLNDGVVEALNGSYDVIFLDVRMPDGSGLRALPKIRELTDPPEVIIITGAGDPDGAELAIVNGAWDYIEKQSSIKRMTLPLVRALQYREEKKVRRPAVALKLDGIVGDGFKMQACYDIVAQAADSDANVLIFGETGTGKELFARAVHANSHRSNKSFVVVDCAALPESLVESALFGYEKGAFTGADKPQLGLIKQADGGTLFLDEVGELPLIMQKAFLRVLQERRFRPLGARQEVESNFRLLAATNRDLDLAVADGTFRKDLLFRLRSLSLTLPPLRDHLEDIKDLVLYQTGKLCDSYNIPQKGFAPEFFECLLAYEWPGNVRELINTLDRAIAEARHEPTLYPNHLPSYIRIQAVRNAVSRETQEMSPAAAVAAGVNLPKLRDYREAAVAQAEREYLQELMVLAQNDLQEACRISDMSQPRLYALLKKHRVNRSKIALEKK